MPAAQTVSIVADLKKPLAYLISEDDSRKRFPISSATCRIGRSRDNDMKLIDNSVSRKHAEIRRNFKGQFVLYDRESAAFPDCGDSEVHNSRSKVSGQEISPGLVSGQDRDTGGKNLAGNWTVRLFPDLDGGTDGHIIAQFRDLLIGQRNTAFRPVLLVMDGQLLFGDLADSVQSDITAEYGVLRWYLVVTVGNNDLLELTRIDSVVDIPMPGVHLIWIIDQHEKMEPAVCLEIENLVGAYRCLVVATLTLGPVPATPD